MAISNGQLVNTENGSNFYFANYNPATEGAGVEMTLVVKCIANQAAAVIDDFQAVQAQETPGVWRRYWACWGAGGFQIKRRYNSDEVLVTGAHAAPVQGQVRWLGLRRYNTNSYQAYIWDTDPRLGGVPLETITSPSNDASWAGFTVRGVGLNARPTGSPRPTMDDFTIFGAA